MQPLKQLMPRAVAELVRASPMSPGKVDFAWRLAVGPAVQRNTAIRLEEGLLLVDAAGPQWADEIRRSSRVILARLQTMLGETAVSRVVVRER